MPEKLLTIREVAEHLGVSEDEVKRLVDIGEIPAYRIGGTFLRFRKEQLDAIRSEISSIEEAEPEHARPAPVSEVKEAYASTDYDYTAAEKVRDFFYFNDFYILSFIIITVLLYIILRT